MKKIIVILLALILAFTLTSCNKNITINFETNQESIVLEPLIVEKNTSVNLSEYTDQMTLDGYVFKGWYLDKNLSEYVRALDVSNVDITLYAKWAKVYNVSFESNGGSTVQNLSVEDGKIAEEPEEDPVKAGYLFDGWYSDNEFKRAFDFYQEIHADTVIYAKWLKSCHISFVTSGSSVNNLEFVAGGNVVQITQTSTKPGYDFDGWFKDAALTTVITNTQGLLDDTSVYAKFTPHTYTLIYDRNGGQGTSERVSATYDSDITLKECEYTKVGYTFKEWNTKADGTGTAYSPNSTVKNLTEEARGEASLYAIYTPNEYTIKFDNNGGTGAIANMNATYDTNITLTQNSFTKTGYTFKEWNTSADGTGTSYDDAASVKNLATSGEVTLYAIYNECEYTVNFNKNNENATGSIDSLKIKYTESKELPSAAYTLYGYNFKEWNTKADGTGTAYQNEARVTGAIGDITLYAIYDAKEVTVSFVVGSGTQPDSIKVRYDGNYSNLPTPSRVGYSFDGFYLDEDLTNKVVDNTKVTNAENHSLYAKWSPLTFTIKFDKNSDTAVGSISDITFTYPSEGKLTKNTLTNEGMFFQGWSVTKTGNVQYHDEADIKDIRVSNDELVITLYAVWFNGYTISFNTDGGSRVEPITQVIGGEISKPADPTKTGYIFKGWLDGETLVTEFPTVMMEGGKNYKASWQAITYKVVFNKNDENATGSMADLTVSYDETKALTSNAFSLAHYNFIGWALTADGDVAYANGASITNLTSENNGTITLYAKYEETTKTIIYNKNNESATGTVNNTVVEKAHVATLKANSYSLVGHTFKEWNTKADGTGTSYAESQEIEIYDTELTLYAIWTKNTYTITFSTYGGSEVASETIQYGDNYKLVNSPTKTGYTFKEWNTKADGTGTTITTLNTYTIEGNQVLHAIYTANTYTVVFNKNDESATGSMDDQTLTYGETSALSKNNYKVKNYHFKEWNTSADGMGTSYLDQDEVVNLATSGTLTLYAIWEHFNVNVNIVIYNEGELIDTKYTYEVVAGSNIVSGQTYNVNEAILSINDIGHDYPAKTFKGYYTSTALTTPVSLSDIYDENNTNTINVYAYLTTEVTFDLSEGGYDNVVIDLHEHNNHNVLNLLPNVREKDGYIYFFLIGSDDEDLHESKTITVKFYKNDPYSLYVAGVTKSELPSSGGYKYEVTIDDVTYTSYYVYSGIYSFSLEDASVLYSTSDKFNNDSLSYVSPYTKLTFNPQVGGYALVKGTKDLALKYYQLHISQLTSGFSLSSGYYDYENLSMETSKYLNKEKGIYSSNPYQVGSDNIYKLRFNILDANSVPIESADFNKAYTAKLLGDTEEAEKTTLVSNSHNAKDIVVGTISYNGIEYGVDNNEDGTLDVVYFYVLNTNDSDDDTTYDRIKFTSSAVGKRFEITITPMNTGNSQNDEASATLKAFINNGLNVESHEELKDAYANYMINESDVSPIINIHSKILCKLEASQLYLGSPINVSSGYNQAKIHQLGATLSDGMSNTGNVYVRAVNNSEVYNNNLTINGNFFVIDGSELPVVQLNENGEGLSSTQADNNNGTFFNEHSKYKGKYIKNIQIGIFHEYLAYMVSEDQIGYKQIDNSVTYNNMNIISNTITPVVNFQDPEAAQDAQVEIALRNSGGYNGIMARRCKIDTNNIVLDYCGIGLTASFDGASIDAKDTYIYYSWANSIYSYGSNVVKLTNSECRYSGGASIHFDNIEDNLCSSDNTNKVIYHYNSLTQTPEEMVMTKKASLDIDQKTQLVNWVNGSEIWFQLYDMSALSGQLLEGMQGYVSGSTVNGEQSNMYSVVKSYSRLSEGDTAYTSSFSGEYGGTTNLFNFAVIYREKTQGSGAQILYHNVLDSTFRNNQTNLLDTTISRLPMYTEGGDGSFQTFARMDANGISKPIMDAAQNPLPLYCYPVSRYSGYANSTQDLGGVTGNSLAQALSTYQGYTGNKALLVGADLATNEGTFYTESAYAYGLSEHGIINHDGTPTNYGWLEVGLDYPGVLNCYIYTYYYNGYDIVK